MCSNVIPSAPQEESSLYPQLPKHDFRMQKANEVSAALNAEVAHYRCVAKKYKRAKKAINWNSASCGMFSSASLASALSIVGLPAADPLGGVGGAFAAASSGLIIASKKEIVTLAIAKRDTVHSLFSKALIDNQTSDGEFHLLMAEFSQYNVLKDAVRAKLTRQSSRPDVEKIKKDVRSEIEAEFRKEINALAAGSN